MPSSRDAILKAVRAAPVPAAELPPLFAGGIRYPDPVGQFAESLKTVGGKCLSAPGLRAAREMLPGELPPLAGRRICSLLPEVLAPSFDVTRVGDPHELEDVWVAVVPGEFAVAENAAIWVRGDRLGHQVIPFITQHLVLVVPEGEVVHNMHEAYARLQFVGGGFGVFISGPSKTADIEQSLVIGAHGARSLRVLFVGSEG